MTTTQAPLMIGARYLVGEPLGLGAGSDVFRGEDRVLLRPVVIKIAAPEHSAAYRASLGASARIGHPAFVGIYDSLIFEGRVVIVQEYVGGQRFADLANAALNPFEIARVGQDLALALAHAHRQGVVHGDLTPAAIFRDQWGAMRINNLLLPPDRAYFAAAARLLAGDTAYWPEVGTPQEDLRAVGVLLWLLCARQAQLPDDIGGPADWDRLASSTPASLRVIIQSLLKPAVPPAYENAEDLTLALRACARGLRAQLGVAPLAPPWESPRDSQFNAPPPVHVDLPDMIETHYTPVTSEAPRHWSATPPLARDESLSPGENESTWPDDPPSAHHGFASRPAPTRQGLDVALWVGLAVALFLFFLVLGFFMPGLLGR